MKIQAETQANARAIRKIFSGGKWKREYYNSPGTKWWEWHCWDWNGTHIDIYAIKDAPATCKAIYKEHTTVEKIPVRFEEQTVTEQVLVGWDCGNDKQTD